MHGFIPQSTVSLSHRPPRDVLANLISSDSYLYGAPRPQPGRLLEMKAPPGDASAEAATPGGALAVKDAAPPKVIEHIGRKMQILVLHGRQSNEALASVQVMALVSMTKKDADVHYLEGDESWTFRSGVDLHDATDLTRALAKGKPFLGWFDHTTDDTRSREDFFCQTDPNVAVTYTEPERAVEKFLDYVESSGPIDVVLAIFEGSLVVHMAIAKLMEEGREPPWRFTAFFGSMPIRDKKYAAPFAEKKSAHPTAHIFGRFDEYYYYCRTGGGVKAAEDYYERPLVFEGFDGHQLPSMQPRAAQIYDRLAEEMRYQCGILRQRPATTMNPPKPLSPPLLNLDEMMPRKLRVLSLCGGHSCEKINQVQVIPMMARLGNKDIVEWTFKDGDCDWTYFKGEPIITDTERALSKGSQLKNWYMDTSHDDSDRLNRDKQFDPEVWVEYHEVEKRVRDLENYIMENGPFDVIVGFSQGAIMLHLLIGHMRRADLPEGFERWHHMRHGQEHMPWRLSVFFSGMHIRDKKYFDLFETKSPHPTVHVFGKEDEFYNYSRDGFGNKPQEQYYQDPVVITHNQSHMFPSEQPKANMVYDRVAREIWKHCGGKPEMPMTL